ncbi:MAG: UDP-2,3-diacylglucosamine diphosphatase [Gemmatimonadales bacterium]
MVVADAHLGYASEEVGASFRRFLRSVPRMAACLVVNGDLFDFWFEYRTVIPRAAFPTLAELRAVVETGVRVVVTGGNHDRWGGGFWRDQVGVEFHREAVELELAGWRTLVAHGDGVADPEPRSRVLHAIVHHPATARAFRWIHPDLGLRLVRRLSESMPGKWATEDRYEKSAARQLDYARRILANRTELDLLILGHTHRPVIERVGDDRWYLNPGAWMEGGCFALITPHGPELKRFGMEGWCG